MKRDQLTFKGKQKRVKALRTLQNFASFLQLRGSLTPARALSYLRDQHVLGLLGSREINETRKAAELLL